MVNVIRNSTITVVLSTPQQPLRILSVGAKGDAGQNGMDGQDGVMSDPFNDNTILAQLQAISLSF